jgi:uncharacterized DUF497 family protein
MTKPSFEWDERKDAENQAKHRIPFALAQYAFADPKRVIAEDRAHSTKEQQYFCFGRVGEGILTVRFTYRAGVIRIFGAGYWRKGKTIYEKESRLHE